MPPKSWGVDVPSWTWIMIWEIVSVQTNIHRGAYNPNLLRLTLRGKKIIEMLKRTESNFKKNVSFLNGSLKHGRGKKKCF